MFNSHMNNNYYLNINNFFLTERSKLRVWDLQQQSTWTTSQTADKQWVESFYLGRPGSRSPGKTRFEPVIHHGSVWGRRVQRLLPALLEDGQDPPDAPLQTHLLWPVLRDHVTGQERPADRGLPLVSQSDVHWPWPQLAGSTVGQQQALGPDTRGCGQRGWGGRGGRTEAGSWGREDRGQTTSFATSGRVSLSL